MKYRIEVVETLSRFVEVEAENLDDAFERVEEEYNMGEIILDYSDAQEAKLVCGNPKYIEYIIY